MYCSEDSCSAFCLIPAAEGLARRVKREAIVSADFLSRRGQIVCSWSMRNFKGDDNKIWNRATVSTKLSSFFVRTISARTACQVHMGLLAGCKTDQKCSKDVLTPEECTSEKLIDVTLPVLSFLFWRPQVLEFLFGDLKYSNMYSVVPAVILWLSFWLTSPSRWCLIKTRHARISVFARNLPLFSQDSASVRTIIEGIWESCSFSFWYVLQVVLQDRRWSPRESWLARERLFFRSPRWWCVPTFARFCSSTLLTCQADGNV